MKNNQITSKKLRFIAYCGLYCPKCYKMKIASSAKLLLAELESAQKKGAQFLKESPALKPILEKLVGLECKKLCREGGGKSAVCPLKICCSEHKTIGCWQCPDFTSCKKLKPQFLANNRKLRKLSIEEYINQYQ